MTEAGNADGASGAGGALIFGKGTLVSRILGFVRDVCIAALLGGGWLSDAFLVAFRLPNFARRLLAEGALAYALAPAYQSLEAQDAARADAFARSASIALVLIFGLPALVGIVFSRSAALLLAPGLAASPEVLDCAAVFLALCLPYLPLAAGAGVSSAVLVARRRFRAPAYAPVVLNLSIILTALLAVLVYGTGDARAPYLLCAGTVAAGLAQWLCLALPLARTGFSFRGPLGFRDKVLRNTLGALPATAFGAAGNQANILLAAFFASFLGQGSISALYFAERLIEFPLGLAGVPFGLAALPDLVRLAPAPGNGENAAAFRITLSSAVRQALFFGFPAAVGVGCLAPSLVSALFGHGSFGPQALDRTILALLAYLPGLPALSAVRPLLAGCAALGDTRTPWRAAMAGLGVTALFGGLAVFCKTGWGPALGVSAAAWINAGLLVRALASRTIDPRPPLVWLGKVCAACAIMAACVLLAGGFFASPGIRILCCVPLGVLTYFASAGLFRIGEAGQCGRVFLNFLRKR